MEFSDEAVLSTLGGDKNSYVHKSPFSSMHPTDVLALVNLRYLYRV